MSVFLSGEGEAGGGRGGVGGKIYLLLSENFDPAVVNLSKESSQLNRKHEKERWGCRGGGGWAHP